MTFNKIVSEIAKLEGKKKQVPVGNIREVLSCLTIIENRQVLKGGKASKNPLKTLKKMSNKKLTVLKKEMKRAKNGPKKL